jgi:hypothetical protein
MRLSNLIVSTIEYYVIDFLLELLKFNQVIRSSLLVCNANFHHHSICRQQTNLMLLPDTINYYYYDSINYE